MSIFSVVARTCWRNNVSLSLGLNSFPLRLKALSLTRCLVTSQPSSSATASPSPSHPPPILQRDNTWNKLESEIIKKTRKVPTTPEEIWKHNSDGLTIDAARRTPANAYTGRSVRVVANDIAGALKRLDIRLARNKVRHELKRAERHEKKGVKRRRLSSERWRKQFADEVRKKVLLVNAIRHRGA